MKQTAHDPIENVRDETVIPLAIVPKPRKQARATRFKLSEFTNASGTESFRVSGYKRTGERVRENFAELKAAQCRQLELETEYLARDTSTEIRATKLTDTQLRIAETSFIRLNADNELLLAVDYWLRHGKSATVKSTVKLDIALEAFKAWLTPDCDLQEISTKAGIALEDLRRWISPTCELRTLTRTNLIRRVNAFCKSLPNIPLSDITPETVEAFLAKRDVSAKSKDNDRRAVSRFFSWCMERPRRWASLNPCRKEKGRRNATEHAPEILTLSECEALLRRAERHNSAMLAPYVSVCLFAGLRPFEASRLTWNQVNLTDKEIRLEAWQTKTNRPRVVSICDSLAAWLEAYKGKPFFPANWRRHFDAVKVAAGVVKAETAKSEGTYEKKKKGKTVQARRYWQRLIPVHWEPDIMRHTAISHYFRKTGSYGETAEQFGNSEAIIKNHYQGRVSSEDAKRFYAILPQAVKRTKKTKA